MPESAVYIERSKGKQVGSVMLHTKVAANQADSPLGFAVIVDEHCIDWSDAASYNPGNTLVDELSKTVFNSLHPFIACITETVTSRYVEDLLLKIFKDADIQAARLGVAVSLLAAVWLRQDVYIASVGTCKAYLIRNQEMKQLNTDDFARILVDGTVHVLPNMLLNSIGQGNIETVNDIHFLEMNMHKLDLLLICNEAFYDNVSKEKILDIQSRNPDSLNELCRFLGSSAHEETDQYKSALLCLVKF